MEIVKLKYINIYSKTLSDDINKPNMSPKTPTETQVIELLKVDLSHKNANHSFVYHNVDLMVLDIQNTIPEKNKIYESNRNRIYPNYERLPLAV